MVAFRTGQKSKASLLALVPGDLGERPAPPDYLNEAECAQWWLIVNRMPVTYFTREYHPLLAAYCQHIILAQSLVTKLRAACAIDKIDIQTLKAQNIIQGMLNREHRSMAMLATRLNLTPQTDPNESRQKQKTARKQEPTTRSAFQVDDSAA